MYTVEYVIITVDCIKVGDQVECHDFNVAVIDIPSKVRGLVIDEVIGTAVLLKWKPPKDNGSCDLIGYQVEKRDKKSGDKGEWYVAFDKVRLCQANVQNLVMGNDYQFRIKDCTFKFIRNLGQNQSICKSEFKLF